MLASSSAAEAAFESMDSIFCSRAVEVRMFGTYNATEFKSVEYLKLPVNLVKKVTPARAGRGPVSPGPLTCTGHVPRGRTD